jgi:hypothetical protein
MSFSHKELEDWLTTKEAAEISGFHIVAIRKLPLVILAALIPQQAVHQPRIAHPGGTSIILSTGSG